MDAELRNLRIDRSQQPREKSSRTKRLALIGATFTILSALGLVVFARVISPVEVEVARVETPTSFKRMEPDTILSATGYVVAAHKIEVAPKVVGRVAWVGVDRGDVVKEGQEIVRLEADEYRARLIEAEGQLESLQARLAALENGSRPQEIGKAAADVEQARADLEQARLTLERTRKLAAEGIVARQLLDDAQAKHDALLARVRSLENIFSMVKIGPREEEIAALRGEIRQAEGAVAFARIQLDNTIIRAPISGTILERNVEKGEFVTTGFVGDRGAKGYVVSIADLRDLQVDLDISENDFAKIKRDQPVLIRTDAYPDRTYHGVVEKISPEANRQKATIPVKVKVLDPDDYLRPDMSAKVAFISNEGPKEKSNTPSVTVPASAVRNGAVFVVVDGRAVRRPVNAIIGGEDVIIDPPEELKDGSKVRIKEAQ